MVILHYARTVVGVHAGVGVCVLRVYTMPAYLHISIFSVL